MRKINYLEEELKENWKLDSPQRIVNKILESQVEKREGLDKILDTQRLVACSYALGEILAKRAGLKAGSLRKFYQSLMFIKGEKEDKEVRNKVLSLKPYLSYETARKRREVTPLFKVLNPLLERVYNKKDYLKLCQFLEAVIAYHKFHGGRD